MKRWRIVSATRWTETEQPCEPESAQQLSFTVHAILRECKRGSWNRRSPGNQKNKADINAACWQYESKQCQVEAYVATPTTNAMNRNKKKEGKKRWKAG